MRILLALLCATFIPAALAQVDIHVGVVARNDQTGVVFSALDGLLKAGNFGMAGEYVNKRDWLIAGRGYFYHGCTVQHPCGLFFQEGLRRYDLPGPTHPYILQSGIGIDGRVVGKLRMIAILSAGERLKSPSAGYVASLGAYYYVGHGFALRALAVRVNLAHPGYQVGVGFNYVIHIKK